MTSAFELVVEGEMRIVTSPLRALAAILVWLSFVGMASPAPAQGPTPTPTGPSAILPLGPPARITVHPRPHLHNTRASSSLVRFGLCKGVLERSKPLRPLRLCPQYSVSRQQRLRFEETRFDSVIIDLEGRAFGAGGPFGRWPDWQPSLPPVRTSCRSLALGRSGSQR
jgi:hypothetical protein